MTKRPWFVLLFLVSLAAPAAGGGIDDPPRLRIVDRQLRALLEAGVARSPSLRALVERLASSDVVVYLRCAALPPHLDGRLTFVSAVGGFRYVLVHIAAERSALRKIAALGHELQHAVEIAAHPEIVDHRSLARAYAAFGFERRAEYYAATAFDTLAAMAAGEQVRREITHSPAEDE
jgi:hypothetical protein